MLSLLLRQVYNQPGGTTLLLMAWEKKAILAFLYTLTDTTFTNDPRFSAPFALLIARQRQ